MNCTQCLHFDVCGRIMKRVQKGDAIYERIETVCFYAMDKSKPQGDLVEVVRCAKCRYNDYAKPDKKYGICRRTKRIVTDYDFCSFGERE